MKIREKLQFINCFPEWIGLYFTRLDLAKTDMALIYKWYFGFLWFEVRRWADRMVDEGDWMPLPEPPSGMVP